MKILSLVNEVINYGLIYETGLCFLQIATVTPFIRRGLMPYLVSLDAFIYTYEAGAFKSETGAISLQPLGGERATIPHMKAKHVPYQLVYGP